MLRKIMKKYLRIEDILPKEIDILVKEFKNITDKYNLNIFTCGEKDELLRYDFNKGAYLFFKYASKLLKAYNRSYKLKRQTVRKEENIASNCVKMCDIGTYNSYLSKSRYCYANFEEDNVNNDYLMHDDSILLIRKQEKDDITKIR